jgi:hypothetical protein
MSVRRPRALGRFVKWFLIPVALAAIGVFGVGPYLNRAGFSGIDRYRGKPKVVNQTVETDLPEKKFGEPEVEVSVSPSSRHMADNSSRRTTPRRRKRTRRKTKPQTNVEAPIVAPDQPSGPTSDG